MKMGDNTIEATKHMFKVRKHLPFLCIQTSVVAAKIDMFAKNGYNKCNKFRKIMKLIT